MNEELKVLITAEISKLKSEVNKASKHVKEFGDTGKKTSQNFKKAMDSIGKVAKVSMKVVATSIAAGAAALIGLNASTEEYREAQNKLAAAFESAGSNVEQAKRSYGELYRVLGDSDVAVEAANHLAKLTTNQQDLSEWTNICQGVYATFGDSLPIESLTEAANETAKTGELTGALADALNWAGINEESFQAKLDACNTEAEREQLIRETLNTTYSDAAAKYEEVAASAIAAREAQMKLTEVSAQLGETITPLITLFKEGLAEALNALLPSIQLITGGIVELFSGVKTGAQSIYDGVLGVIENLVSGITEYLPTIIELGTTIFSSLIQGVTTAIPILIEAVVELIPTIIESLTELLPQLIVMGTTLITEILNGMAQAIPLAAPMIGELIITIVDTLIEALPDILDAGIALISAIVDAIPVVLPKIIEAIPDIIDAIVEVLDEALPTILEAGVTIFTEIINAIPQVLPSLIDALPKIIDTITTVLIDNLPIILDAGLQIFTALIEAIPLIIPKLVEAIPTIISSIVKALIDSIPKVAEAAVKLFMGIVESIPKIIGSLIEACGEIVKTVIDNLVNGLKKALDFKWELPKLKLPKISISGKFSLNPIQWPKFSITWAAKGGVFDNTTLFGYGNGSLGGLGENGAEAVVPLENNLGWLNKLADMLDERMATGKGNVPIVLQVDGRTFAETTIRTLNNRASQTGNLGLNIY